MTTNDMERSKIVETSDTIEAIEECYRMGWSDGLPVVPPVDYKVRELLALAGLTCEEEIIPPYRRSRVLRPDGVYVINVIDYPPLSFVRAEVASFSMVFPYVGVLAPLRYLDGEAGGNFVLVASDAPIAAASITALVEDGSGLIVGGNVLVFTDGAAPLTDNFAPADQLISRR